MPHFFARSAWYRQTTFNFIDCDKIKVTSANFKCMLKTNVGTFRKLLHTKSRSLIEQLKLRTNVSRLLLASWLAGWLAHLQMELHKCLKEEKEGEKSGGEREKKKSYGNLLHTFAVMPNSLESYTIPTLIHPRTEQNHDLTWKKYFY